MQPYLRALQRSKYGYIWVTAVFFLVSFLGHWLFAWFVYVHEQEQSGAPIEVSAYLNETLRDTFENWQSEFLQLMWQVAGLAYLLYIGSPQSRESSDRTEQKLDAILFSVNPKEANEIIQYLEKRYPKK